MDKKGIIAVALAIIVMVVWQFKFAPKYIPPPVAASPTPGASATPAPSAAAAPVAPVTKGETVLAAPEQLQKVSSPAVEYDFTNLGGGIARAILLNHMAEAGKNVTLNEFGSLPIGAISDLAGEAATPAYTITKNPQTGEVTCERTDANGVQIVKKFTLPSSAVENEQYTVQLDVSFTNRGTKPYTSNGYYIYVGSASPIHQRDLPTYTGFDFYRGGKATYIDVNWFSAASLPLIGIQRRPERPFYDQKLDNIVWAGVKSQYFTTIVVPELTPATSVWAHRFPVKTEEREWQAIEGALGLPGFALAPGETHAEQFSIYAGPKIYDTLKKIGHNEDEIMNFGIFKWVSQILLNSMNWLHSVLHSYAAAIIVLTLCIKSILWPLQNKATASMKKMQVLQPKMTELREKYKDDPTRMNEELMKLYKQYGVNPFGGCLPMVVQIPIFFGFYSMLGTAFELRNSKFLWVHDLSQPDTVATLAGFNLNILPLCMAGTMLWQMSLSPKSGDQMQQRVFMFVPLIFIFFCYNFASALALYWTVQNVFSIVQLYVTRSQTAPVLQKVTAPRKKKP